MKLSNIINEKRMSTLGMVYTQDYFRKSLEDTFSQFNKKVNKLLNEYFSEKRGAERLVSSVNKYEELIGESNGRSSVRMSILNKAWRATIKFERPSVRKIIGEERDNIISFLVENKDKVKFSSTGKDEFGVKASINSAVDTVFKEKYLRKIFESSDKALFYAINDEIKKYISKDIAESKSFKLNTEKRISELDITFLDTLKKKNLINEPNGSGMFPDYEYKFSGEAGYEGEQQIYNILEEAGIRGTFKRVYIEMKGDKSSRVVATQTSPEKFFNGLGGDLAEKIQNMEMNDKIDLSASEFRKFIDAANIYYAFKFPIIYVKSAMKKLLVFYLGDLKVKRFSLKRNKRSLSLSVVAVGDNIKEQKVFSVEFTSKAYKKIFGE
jgi:hypothetical protein